jgi:hypothetical protein
MNRHCPTSSRLRVNDDRTGKMAFVKRLNLLDQRHIRFMRRLSEMRNAFSHGIENVDNTVDEFLRSIDDEKRHSYLGAFSAMLNDQALIATHSVKAIDFARENPRLAIWLGTLDTVAWVYLQIQEIDLASEERVSGEAARDILRLIAAGELV